MSNFKGHAQISKPEQESTPSQKQKSQEDEITSPQTGS